MSKQKKGGRPRRVDYWHDPAAPTPPAQTVRERDRPQQRGQPAAAAPFRFGQVDYPTRRAEKTRRSPSVRYANAARKPGWALRSPPWWGFQ